jgi:hypothetical protein
MRTVQCPYCQFYRIEPADKVRSKQVTGFFTAQGFLQPEILKPVLTYLLATSF